MQTRIEGRVLGIMVAIVTWPEIPPSAYAAPNWGPRYNNKNKMTT